MNTQVLRSVDMKAKLSTLWIFVMFNMIYADILSFMYPGFLQHAGYPERMAGPGLLTVAEASRVGVTGGVVRVELQAKLRLTAKSKLTMRKAK